MNKTRLPLHLVILTIVLMWLAPNTFAQETDPLEVDLSVICTGIEDLEPIGTGISFPVSLEKLYCLTRILGALTPTTITHVWIFENTERARVDLAVMTYSWRTYSSKIIQPHEVGSWRVEVLDSEGMVLKRIQFITTPPQEMISDAPNSKETKHTRPSSLPEMWEQ